MSEEKILDVEEVIIEGRMKIILEKCVELSLNLRKNIDESKNNEELLQDDNFKKWIIINEIINKCNSDSNFVRMFYYLYEKFDNDLVNLLSYYDLEIKRDKEGNITEILLINYE